MSEYSRWEEWQWCEFFVGVFVGVVGLVLFCIFITRNDPSPKDINKQYIALQQKYDALSCKTRGLVVTEVKGITLCMDEKTRSLHKIDGE